MVTGASNAVAIVDDERDIVYYGNNAAHRTCVCTVIELILK